MKMTNEQKKAILESVIDSLSNIDTLVQYTVPNECYDIHNQIDILIDQVSEIIDTI